MTPSRVLCLSELQAAAWLHKQYRGSRIAVSAASGAEGADIYLEPGAELAFGSRRLEALFPLSST
jgi:hypothetical protein